MTTQDVMAYNFTEYLIKLCRPSFAFNRISKLRLNHMNCGFCIPPFVVMLIEFIIVQHEIMIHLFPYCSFLISMYILLEWDKWSGISRISALSYFCLYRLYRLIFRSYQKILQCFQLTL